jgi:DUF4097 and DUF4098 domain-containing protein YvlB
MLIAVPFALAALVGQQPQTDTTLTVPAGARLEVSNLAGTTRITTWDRSAVRVRARHGSRDIVEVELRGSVVAAKARPGRGGMPHVDYEITVPRAMPVSVDGVENEVTVEGVAGTIRVATVEGAITVRGAGGEVSLNSVDGDVALEGGRGRIAITAVDGTVTVTGARGEVTVETVDGDITLDQVESADVRLGTVDGNVTYRGTVQDGGRYRLTTHDGDVVFAAPAGISATVSVSTFDGSFEADPAFSVQISQVRPGRRFSFTLGTGSARVELESFEGMIRLEKR